MGNKYSETPYGTCFTEFGSDFKQMEEERKKLVVNITILFLKIFSKF